MPGTTRGVSSSRVLPQRFSFSVQLEVYTSRPDLVVIAECVGIRHIVENASVSKTLEECGDDYAVFTCPHPDSIIMRACVGSLVVENHTRLIHSYVELMVSVLRTLFYAAGERNYDILEYVHYPDSLIRRRGLRPSETIYQMDFHYLDADNEEHTRY